MRADKWEQWLSTHTDRNYVAALTNIIRRGVKVGYSGRQDAFLLNHPHNSALNAPEILLADLAKQQLHSRLRRLDDQPTPPFISSPLGLVPKHDGGWRRIHDLSFPAGESVNDGIPPAYGAVEYTTVDEAFQAILTQGRHAILVKRDLTDAFRHIPIAESDLWLLGFFCDGSYWIDCFLPFGLRTAPFLFDLFAKGLHWILIAIFSWALILHYLDDFLAVLPPDADYAQYEKDFDMLCNELGLSVNAKKNVTGFKADFLGIELDTAAMEARLPPDKLARARATVDELLKSETVTHTKLESSLGFLSFAAKVAIPGRAFLRRLWNALGRGGLIHHITKDMKADLHWWQQYLRGWNGVYLLRLNANRHHHHIWTDASGKLGIGGYRLNSPTCMQAINMDDVFSLRIPTRLRLKDIQFKEMWAVRHALHQWQSRLGKSMVILYCDNQAVCAGIKNSSIRGQAMAPLREICLQLARLDIAIKVHWIPTKANALADQLSRFQFGKIADVFPQLAKLKLRPISSNSRGSHPSLPNTSGGDSPIRREAHTRRP